MKERRSRFQIKVAGAKRLFMWHVLSRQLSLVLVTEYPKAGGSWFSQMISDACGLPFPRNETPLLESCIMHGHHLYVPRYGPVIGLVRDGRDIMVSAYFHFLFENDRNSSFSVNRHRSVCDFADYDDVIGNMPDFIRYMFGHYAENRIGFDWAEFVRSCTVSENVLIVRYEDLLIDAANELKKTFEHLGIIDVSNSAIDDAVSKNSFTSMSSRKEGEEDKSSFLRKGVAGDWKNYFSKESVQLFNELAGAELESLGYEVVLND